MTGGRAVGGGTTADPLVIRPDPGRHRAQALAGVPLALIGATILAVRLSGEFGWLAVPILVALTAPPAALIACYLFRHRRVVKLETVDGGLRSTDWLGRRQALLRAASVCYCTLYSGGGRMEHVVVAGAFNERPLVLRTRQWRRADLERVWRRLGLAPEVDDLTSVRGVRFRFPGAPLPLVTRHPMIVVALVVGAAFGYIWLVITLARGVTA